MSDNLNKIETQKQMRASRIHTYTKSWFWAALALLLIVVAIYIFVKMGFSFCWWGNPLSPSYNWGCGA